MNRNISHLCLALLAFSSCASASVVLDQSYIPVNGGNLTAGLASYNTNQEWAQTFTVGQTGTLAQVDLDYFRYSGSTGNLIADIRGVNASGFPTTNLASIQILGSSIPTFPNTPTFEPFDFSGFGIKVIPGEHLAIVVHAGVGDLSFNFVGDTTTPYTGGQGLGQEIGNHSWDPLLNAATDLGFETFVNVPEPSAALAITVVAVVAAMKRDSRT